MDYGFCDLCVDLPENKQIIKETLIKLQEVGYKTVVLNQNVDENVFDSEKKKRKKSNENDTIVSSVPEPIDVQDMVKEFNGKLNILNRITFSFSDPAKTHSLNQLPILKKYNLYAIVPKSQAALQFACAQLNADIISIKSGACRLKLTRKLYLQAIEKGTHFEIQYSDIINNTSRRFAIHFSHLLFTFGKSRNVVISSGASDALLIRNPYDIINLSRLLGLNETKAKFAILQQAHRVLLRGEGRRCGRVTLKISNNEKDNDLKDDLYCNKAKRIKL